MFEKIRCNICAWNLRVFIPFFFFFGDGYFSTRFFLDETFEAMIQMADFRLTYSELFFFFIMYFVLCESR